MTVETPPAETVQETARTILARLATRGPSTPKDLTGDGVPNINTAAFGEAFAILTRSRLVRTVGYTPGVRGHSHPIFEATTEGRDLAERLAGLT